MVQRTSGIRQLSTPRLAEFDQRLNANEAPLMIFQPLGHFLPLWNERVHSFAEQDDVLPVLDDLGKETHAGTGGFSSAAIASASPGWPLSQDRISSRT